MEFTIWLEVMLMILLTILIIGLLKSNGKVEEDKDRFTKYKYLPLEALRPTLTIALSPRSRITTTHITCVVSRENTFHKC